MFDRPVSWVPVLELPSIKQEAFRILPQKTIAFVMRCLEILIALRSSAGTPSIRYEFPEGGINFGEGYSTPKLHLILPIPPNENTSAFPSIAIQRHRSFEVE